MGKLEKIIGDWKIMAKIRFNRGFHDGLNSKTFKTPIHKFWNGKPHFDSTYEAGYWKGYNKEIK